MSGSYTVSIQIARVSHGDDREDLSCALILKKDGDDYNMFECVHTWNGVPMAPFDLQKMPIKALRNWSPGNWIVSRMTGRLKKKGFISRDVDFRTWEGDEWAGIDYRTAVQIQAIGHNAIGQTLKLGKQAARWMNKK